MSVEEITVTVISCDDCEDAFENSWGDRYFEFPTEDAATEEAKASGWEIVGDRYPDVWCPDCVAKRNRAAEGKPELVEEIPGQLALPLGGGR